MQRIMVPTDFSSNAEKALFFAADIAVKTKGTLLLYSSYTPIDSPFIDNHETRKSYNEEEEILIENKFNLLKEKVRKQYPDLNMQTFIGKSPLVNNILKFGTDHSADIIVMGTKGASGIQKAVIGSVAARIVQKAEIPVLLIPDNDELNLPKNIIFTSDYHNNDLEGMKYTVAFAELYNSKISFLHLIPKHLEEFLFEKEKSKFEEHGAKIKAEFPEQEIHLNLLQTETPSKKIAKLNEVISFDMLVMIPRRKSFFQYLLSESYTKNMAFITEKPLLIVPEI